MPVITDSTQFLGFALPNPANMLEDDVLRLRSALTSIDSKIHSLDLLLASDDPTLDSIQEIVDALKLDAEMLFDHVGSRGEAHDVATASEDGFMSAADKVALDAAASELAPVALGAPFDAVTITPTTNGQTTFAVSGGYVPGQIMVLLNGIELDATDFTATTSPDLVMAVGLQTVDTIRVYRFRQALRKPEVI